MWRSWVACLLCAWPGLGCGDQASEASAEEPGTAQGSVLSADLSAPVEQVALFRGAPAGRLRGRVIYSQTAQPLVDVWVRLVASGSELIVATTDTGHFVAPDSLPDGEVRAYVGYESSGPWSDSGGLSLEHSAANAGGRAHTLRVAAGPTYALEFLSHASDEPTRWEARLIERGESDRLRAWSWQVLRPGDPPRLRYLSVEHPPREEWTPFVEVRLRGKDWFARARVENTRGERLRPLELDLVQYSGFGGLLLDALGLPVDGAQITLKQVTGSETPRFNDRPRVAWSDGDGLFEFPLDLEPGGYHMLVQSEGRGDLRLDLEIDSGRVDGYEVRLSEVSAEEQLAVAIVGSGDDGSPAAIVSLRSTDGGNVRRSLHTGMRGSAHGFVEAAGLGHAMLFSDLPPGAYELSIFSLDGRRYEPSTTLVELPLQEQGVAFVQADGDSVRELSFAVRSRGAEEELGFYGLRISAERWWYPGASRLARGAAGGSLAVDIPDAWWMVWSDGHRPAYGRLSELEGERGPALMEVELEPGWGAEFVMRDAGGGVPRPGFDAWQHAAFVHQATPIEGILVVADGRVVARSDALGRARIALDSRPAELEFRKAGWRALGPQSSGGDGVADLERLDSSRTAAVWFERRP